MLRIFPLILLLSACSSVHPAGALGHVMGRDGAAVTPPPANYRHVPPTPESGGPLRWEAKF